MDKENIRILFISNSSSIHARRWVRAFAERGYDVHLLSPVPWDERSVKTHVLPLYPQGARNPGSRTLRGIQNTIQARRFIKKLSPQIVHLHGLFTAFGPDLMFTVFGQKNLVVSTWGSDILYGGEGSEPIGSRMIKRFILRQAGVVLATSKFQAGITAAYSPREREVLITPFGVDLELFRKHSVARIDSDTVTLGFVKKLEENYGPHVLLEAFKIAEENHKRIRLIFVGNGSMEDELKKRTKELGLETKVEFLGYVDNDLVPRYLNQMDIFVMPSFRETFGVAALEAQAAQIPVVASDIDGIRECVLNGATGYLVSAGDREQFARRIIKLIEDPSTRERMGVEGRKFVSEHYEWQRCVDRVEHIYLGLLGIQNAVHPLVRLRPHSTPNR
jgi:glycosyltransferase involved in cell wall biosynthesis